MWRGPALAAILFALALLPERSRWRRLFASREPSRLARLEERLRPLLQDLPADARLGLILDGDERRRLMEASYVVAPRLLDPGTAPPRILGLLDGPVGWFFYQHPVRLVKDYGGGVLLLEKR
jgi:hypothetical protein